MGHNADSDRREHTDADSDEEETGLWSVVLDGIATVIEIIAHV